MSSEIHEKLKEYFIDLCPLEDDLSYDTDLLNDWFIDSFAIVQTVMFVEETYNISISPDDINEENFFSINTLAAFISKLLS